MESWKIVWRNGLAPLLSDKHLKALEKGLDEDDPNLVQGCTTTPPPLQCVVEWPVEAACALGYCGWKGDELITVSEVEEFFARMCFEIDQKIGEPAGCRWFLNWFDDTPRIGRSQTGDQQEELMFGRYVQKVHTGSLKKVIGGLLREMRDILRSGMREHAKDREWGRISDQLKSVGVDMLQGTDKDEGYILGIKKHDKDCPLDKEYGGICDCLPEWKIKI